MNRPPDPVSPELLHDAKTLSSNLPFNFTPNMASPESGTGDLHRTPECSFRAPYERIRSTRHLANTNRHGSVGKKSVFHGYKIQFYQIAIAQHASAWHTMNSFVIYTDANRARKSVHFRRRSL